MKRLRANGSQVGLTLIETMIALTLFAIFTVGLAPLLASALKGAGVTRSYAVGKNLASESMERMRGLPFFVSVQGTTPPARSDLLDLFFPDTGTGFAPANDTFTTTCTSTSQTPSGSGPSACPKNIPPGYMVTFVAAFVTPTGTTPQQFWAVDLTGSYDWDTVGTERAPSNLLRVAVTASWTYGGQPRTYSLTSLFGQRTLSTETISASGEIDYSVRVLASYLDSQSRRSSLVATAGAAENSIVTRGISEADENTSAGNLVLTQDASGESSAVTLAEAAGAASFVHAPPNSYPATGVSATEQPIAYQPDPLTSIQVGFLDDSVIETPTGFSLGAQVVNELPKAAGKFRFNAAAGGNQPTMWIDNQADRGIGSPLKLDSAAHIVTLERDGATSRLNGQSSAEATALSPTASRKVEAKASTGFARLTVLPTTFISAVEDSVLVVDNFTASLTCTSTAAATAAVAGSWSASLRYWQDPANNGSTADGSYSTPISLSGNLTGGTDPLAALKGSNPLVYDGQDPTQDVYLFQTASSNGYLTDLSSRTRITSANNASGRSTSANLEEAIGIEMAPTSATNTATAMSVSVGSLSCKAVDRRGL